MERTISLRVLTETGIALEDEAVSIIAPGELGYLGVLTHHAPLVSTMQPGKLIWQRPSGERRTLLIGQGLLESIQNRCTILTSRVAEPSPHPADRNAA